MSYTPQPNTFTLFVNDKGDNPKRPDYRGDAVLPDGTKMKLSCWLKESLSLCNVLCDESISSSILLL